MHAVILAGGQASRYGGNKLLSTHPDSQLPLLWHIYRQYRRAGLGAVSVITGHWHEAIKANMPSEIDIVFNQHWQSGLASSVKLANQVVDANKSLLLGLGDQAGLTSKSITTLCSAYRQDAISASQYLGLLGAPAIFPPDQRHYLDLVTDDQGAGKIIRQRYNENLRNVNVVPLSEAGWDIDTPSDWLD